MNEKIGASRTEPGCIVGHVVNLSAWLLKIRSRDRFKFIKITGEGGAFDLQTDARDMNTSARRHASFEIISKKEIAMPDAVDQICRDLEIQIVECRETCGPMRTKAAATLAQIHQHHGAGHLIIVLRTITESAGNERMLIAPVIKAVSELVLAHPSWTATGLRWIEAFDHIGLDAIVAAAKANRSACPVQHGVAALLHQRLSGAFPGPLKRHRERVELEGGVIIHAPVRAWQRERMEKKARKETQRAQGGA